MVSLKNFFHWIKKHCLIVILVLAAILRVSNLATNPPSLNWDEVSMGYTAYSLLKTGQDEWGEPWPLIFRSYGEWKSPVYIYLLVPFIKIFGLNAWAVRLPAAIAGIIAIYLTYLIGKKLYNEKVGLWAAFLLSVSPWHLMLSRPAFEAGVALTLILAGIYYFLKFIDSIHTSKFMIHDSIYSAFCFGLAPHTYNSAKIFVPLFILFLILQYRKKLKLRQYFVYGVVLFVFALPVLLSLYNGKAQGRYKQVGITTDAELTTTFYEYRKTFPLPSFINRLIFSKYSYFLVKGYQNWVSYISPSFLISEGGVRPQHSIPYRGVLYYLEFFFVIYGLFYLKKYSKIGILLPLIAIAIGFIPAAITKDDFHVLRSLLTLPWWQILAAIGIVELSSKKLQYLKFIYSLLAIEVAMFLFSYFAWYPKAFAKDWQYGYKQAIEYAMANEAKYKDIIFTKWFGEPQLFLAFYGKIDPKEFQKHNSSLIRYESQGLPWLDQLEAYKIDKFTFTSLNWKGPGENNNTLYVGKSDDFWVDTKFLKQIYYPDGSIAFNIVEGQ